MKHLICKIGDLPPGEEVQVFPFFGHEVQEWSRRGRIRAAASSCPHLSESFESKDGAFVCRCNSARVAMTDGRRLAGAVPGEVPPMILPTPVEQYDLFRVWAEMS